MQLFFHKLLAWLYHYNEALLFDAFTAVSDEARAKSNKSRKKIKKMFMGTKYAIFNYATKAWEVMLMWTFSSNKRFSKNNN